MKITTIGIDLAKEVFQIHGVDMHGKVLLRKQLRRSNRVYPNKGTKPTTGNGSAGNQIIVPIIQP